MRPASSPPPPTLVAISFYNSSSAPSVEFCILSGRLVFRFRTHGPLPLASALSPGTRSLCSPLFWSVRVATIPFYHALPPTVFWVSILSTPLYPCYETRLPNSSTRHSFLFTLNFVTFVFCITRTVSALSSPPYFNLSHFAPYALAPPFGTFSSCPVDGRWALPPSNQILTA